MTKKQRWAHAGVGVLFLPAVCRADPLKMGATSIEVAISQVTDRTLRLDVVPLDAAGTPRPGPTNSTVFVPFGKTEKLRVRDSKDLPGDKGLAVGAMTVTTSSNPLAFVFHGADGKVVQEIRFREADGSFVFDTPGPTFGLGEGRQQFDRRGFYYDFQNGQNQFLATNGATVPVPFLIGINPGATTAYWGMFVHNPALPANNAQTNNQAWGQFDLRGEDAGPAPAAGGGRRGGAAGGGAPANTLTPPATLPVKGRFIPHANMVNQVPLAVYVMNLSSPGQAEEEYVHLVGNPVMPPKWAMGYMQSHRSLAGPDEVMAVAKRFRDDKLPCDALIYLGTGYTIATQGNQPLGGWNMLNGRLDFNPAIFDKPQEMIDKLHALNFKIILHKTNAPANLHGNINDANVPANDTNHVANYWSRPARGDVQTHTSLMNMGIDAWWPDDGDELPVENRLARIRAYYDGSLKDKPNERPWSLDRNGYASVARYGGWNWSGDVTSTWRTLQNHVPMGLNFSASVSPWWGTDIGGFNGAAEYSGELYARWFEFAAFNPLFRSHGRNWHLHTPWGWDTGDTGPMESTLPANPNLHDAAVEPACKAALELRYSLLPYNYSITREACDTGMPLMRALWFYYADDAEAAKLGDEYMWGPNMLIAPVIQRGATVRHLYLPAGDWYDWATGKKETGKKWIDRPVDLATIPIYVKAGGIVPWDPVRQYTAEAVAGDTTLKVFAGADSTFVLYDDDGHTQGYQSAGDDKTQWVKCTWNDAAKTLTLESPTVPATKWTAGPAAPAANEKAKTWPTNFTRSFRVQVLRDGAAGGEKIVEYKGEKIEVKMP